MQRKLQRYWTLFTLIILVFGAVWIWISAVPGGSTTTGMIPAPKEGFKAPDFELSTLDGDVIAFSELHGKAVLINFWATWCPPCRSEMPAMQQVFSNYSSNSFEILANFKFFSI